MTTTADYIKSQPALWGKTFYIASPITGYKGKRSARGRVAEVDALVLQLTKEGISCFSPATFFSFGYRTPDLPHERWMALCRTLFNKCDALIILKQEGWHTSAGVSMERQWATDKRWPIIISGKKGDFSSADYPNGSERCDGARALTEETSKMAYNQIAQAISDLRPADATLANKDTNPKDAAASNRLPLHLVPSTLSMFAALAFTEGAAKYGAYNWREAGVLASVYRSAAQRHWDSWWNGEDLDPKTGVPHLAYAIACAGIILDAKVCGKLADDRPVAAPVGETIRNMEADVRRIRELFAPKAVARPLSEYDRYNAAAKS